MKKKRGLSTYRAKARNSFYYTVSNGGRLYTNEDGAPDYTNNTIIDPNKSTYINLFVNGVIQPAELYSVSKGKLYFTSDDPPPVGVPIILQFVEIYFTKVRMAKRGRKKRPGTKYSEDEEE